MAEHDVDVVVIGGGPGGYVAAIRASQLGLKAAVVERENLGGICLNWGCIPTKALLRSAEVKHLIDHAKDFGITVGKAEIDLNAVVERSRGVAKRLSSGISHLMKKNKIAVFMASASLGGMAKGKRQVKLDNGDMINAKSVILATGARARALPGIEANGETIVTYRDAMTPKTMPKTLIVVGSGAIGIEFASFYADMGVQVTVIEAMDRILLAEDDEISAMAAKSFTNRGLTLMTGAKLGAVKAGKGVTAEVTHQGKTQSLTADRMILAVGITANTDGIGLEKTKVKLDRGHVITDGSMRTDEPGVYAIGDMTGAPWLAHKASHEGIIAAEHIAGLGEGHGVKKTDIPGCTYCRPQVASVGLSEKAAIAAGHDIKVGRFPFLANGKAIALGDEDGMIKTIFDAKTGELLGAHMIGPEVTELIQGYVVAKKLETTEEDLMHTIFPHPTLSEAMHESVLDAFDKAIHF
ncbi:MAG: dihydrolipoyl dehydrogenase [Alphaproteobacteria bacterium]|nr:dihydrolipoyl dehydrogenase [Alphaproteobacteria bacterium]